MKKNDRDKYKKYHKMRKNPSKYIPHHRAYCYGVVDGRKYADCMFLRDHDLDIHLQAYRNSLLEKGDVIIEEVSAKCSLTGKWIFDYCKHCGVNEDKTIKW